MAMQAPNNNKPGKYKETERFTIRRLVFWLSTAAVVYFSQHWDVTGMIISAVVLSLTLISKFFSWVKENRRN
jgi:hypothetical protein